MDSTPELSTMQAVATPGGNGKVNGHIDMAALKLAARGRWPEILPRLGGVSAEILDGRHHPCPKDGGTDRFRVFGDFADTGGCLCNQCAPDGNADGLATLQWLTGQTFLETARSVAEFLNISIVNGNGKSNQGKGKGRGKRDIRKAVVGLPAESWQPVATDYSTAKPPITVEGIRACGGKVVKWFDGGSNHICFAFEGCNPIASGKLAAIVLVRTDGTPFPAAGKLSERKTHNVGGSKNSWLCSGSEAELQTATTILDVEGITDLLTVASSLPTGWIAVTNTSGAKARGKLDCSWANGKRVIVAGDADNPGVDGKRRAAATYITAGAEVLLAELPYPISEDHGKDLRDWAREGNKIIDLPTVAVTAEQVAAWREEWEEKRREGKQPVTNAEVVDMGDGETQTIPLTMNEVIKRMVEFTGDWPRRVEKSLFIHEAETGFVSWLDSPSSLFGWLGRKCGTIRWSKVLGCVTKEETYSELCHTATAYATVEQLPHEPIIDGHYYTCGAIEPGDGSALKRFLEFFAFETALDRQLFVAIMATPLWGGLPGTRPAGMLTAPTGRGKGKSTAAKMVCRLYGGSVDVSANEDIGVIKQRFLTAEAAHLRIGFLDNLKTTRFSWGELEAFITAAEISGKRLYVGNASRPNYVTWLITLNGASLSTDMSQRVVEVRLASPAYSTSWEETASRFVVEKQLAIIADLVTLLRRPTANLKRVGRWGTWEAHVLGHVADNADECQALILERRGQVDVEVEESEVISDYFAHQLHALAYDAERDDVFIPNEVAARWYVAATGDRCKVTGASRALRQLHAEGRLSNIMEARGAGTLRERGFRWIGHHADSLADTQQDLRKRLAEQAESQHAKGN